MRESKDFSKMTLIDRQIINTTKEHTMLWDLLSENIDRRPNELQSLYLDILDDVLGMANKMANGRYFEYDMEKYVDDEVYKIFTGMIGGGFNTELFNTLTIICNYYSHTLIDLHIKCDVTYLLKACDGGVYISLYEAPYLEDSVEPYKPL